MEELFTHFLEGLRETMKSLYLGRRPKRARLHCKLALPLNQSHRSLLDK
jgi:hypothetical protein